MKRTARWTIALVLLLIAPAMAGCIGSDASAGDAGPTDVDDRIDNADSGDADGDNRAGEETENADDSDEASNADDGSGNETTPSAVPSSMSFSGCDIQVGVFEIPAPLVAEKIPPGFTPTSVVQPAAPTASVVVDAHACDEATSDAFDATVEDVGWVVYLLAVDPPDEYEAEDVDFYWIPLAGVTDSPQVVDAYRAWDLTVEEGTVDLAATDTPAAQEGKLEVRSDNISSTLHTAVSPAAPSEDPDHKARTFVVDDGEVISIAEPTVTASSELRGGAERIVEPGSSDPGEVPFFASENALMTGVGLRFIAEEIDIQHLDPAEVAGN